MLTSYFTLEYLRIFFFLPLHILLHCWLFLVWLFPAYLLFIHKAGTTYWALIQRHLALGFRHLPIHEPLFHDVCLYLLDLRSYIWLQILHFQHTCHFYIAPVMGYSSQLVFLPSQSHKEYYKHLVSRSPVLMHMLDSSESRIEPILAYVCLKH